MGFTTRADSARLWPKTFLGRVPKRADMCIYIYIYIYIYERGFACKGGMPHAVEVPCLRTNGVSTNGAAAKVMNLTDL